MLRNYYFHIKCGGHVAKLRPATSLQFGRYDYVCSNCGILSEYWGSVWVVHEISQSAAQEKFLIDIHNVAKTSQNP